jgi:hypothetical protein
VKRKVGTVAQEARESILTAPRGMDPVEVTQHVKRAQEAFEMGKTLMNRTPALPDPLQSPVSRGSRSTHRSSERRMRTATFGAI